MDGHSLIRSSSFLCKRPVLLTFFPRKHLQYFSLKDRLFYGSVLLSNWEIIVDRWYDQLAALGRWYLSLCIYLIFLISGCNVSVHYFSSSFFVLLL